MFILFYCNFILKAQDYKDRIDNQPPADETRYLNSFTKKPNKKKSSTDNKNDKSFIYRVMNTIKSLFQHTDKKSMKILKVEDVKNIRAQSKKIKVNVSSIELNVNKEIYMMRGLNKLKLFYILSFFVIF